VQGRPRGHGTLVVRVRLAKGREPLTLDTEGEAVPPPLGACIVNDLGAIASSMEVPATRGRLTWTFSRSCPWRTAWTFPVTSGSCRQLASPWTSA
jgi:hypothetical protein